MSVHFEDLNEKVQIEIASLPYMAGIYVANADDVEGDQDDEKEQQAIIQNLKKAREKYQGSVFIPAAIDRTLTMQNHWPQWREASFHVAKTCGGTVAQILDVFGEDEAKNYKTMVLDLARNTAAAANELAGFEDFDEGTQEKGFFEKIKERISGPAAGSHRAPSPDNDPSNISPAEQAAVDDLNKAMKIDGKKQ